MRKLTQLATLAVFAFLTLPACAPRAAVAPGVRSPDQIDVTHDSGEPTPRDKARDAIARFRQHDETNSWTAESCAEVSKALEAASDEAAMEKDGKPIAEALYDAALARLRCGDRAEGRRLLERAIEAQPRDARARTQLVSLDLEASGGRGLDQQQLELAALVCSQAIRKHPRYAPIHNTAALVRIEQGDSTGAAAELKAAIEIDPRMVEALMSSRILRS